MMFKDLSGVRFGRWIVVRRAPPLPYGDTKWFCRCDCGTGRLVLAGNLLSGGSTSCGCLARELAAARSLVHGHARSGGVTPEYRCWRCIIARCTNSNHVAFKDYGARGIHICDRWRSGDGIRSGFQCFLLDMGLRPLGCSIDRIENDRGYEPGNCRWGSAKEQRKNQRPCDRAGERNANAKLTWAAVREIRTLAGQMARTKIARRFGVSHPTVHRVLAGRAWRNRVSEAAQ